MKVFNKNGKVSFDFDKVPPDIVVIKLIKGEYKYAFYILFNDTIDAKEYLDKIKEIGFEVSYEKKEGFILLLERPNFSSDMIKYKKQIDNVYAERASKLTNEIGRQISKPLVDNGFLVVPLIENVQHDELVPHTLLEIHILDDRIQESSTLSWNYIA